MPAKLRRVRRLEHRHELKQLPCGLRPVQPHVHFVVERLAKQGRHVGCRCTPPSKRRDGDRGEKNGGERREKHV